MPSTRPTSYVWIIGLITISFLTVYIATVQNYVRQIETRDKRINSLTYEAATLKKENTDLRNVIDVLNSVVQNLTIENNSLRKNYSEVLTKYKDMSSRFRTLEEKYNDLSNNYNDTLKKLQLLEDIVYLRKNKTLTSFMGVVTVNYSTTYRLEYAGYIKVSFKSDTSIYLIIENEHLDVSYTTRVPVDAPVDSGDYVIPVLPGRLVLRFASLEERHISIKYEVLYVY